MEAIRVNWQHEVDQLSIADFKPGWASIAELTQNRTAVVHCPRRPRQYKIIDSSLQVNEQAFHSENQAQLPEWKKQICGSVVHILPQECNKPQFFPAFSMKSPSLGGGLHFVENASGYQVRLFCLFLSSSFSWMLNKGLYLSRLSAMLLWNSCSSCKIPCAAWAQGSRGVGMRLAMSQVILRTKVMKIMFMKLLMMAWVATFPWLMIPKESKVYFNM